MEERDPRPGDVYVSGNRAILTLIRYDCVEKKWLVITSRGVFFYDETRLSRQIYHGTIQLLAAVFP